LIDPVLYSPLQSFAFSYIKKQSKMVDEKGTGGTDYMPYLAKHARTTRVSFIYILNPKLSISWSERAPAGKTSSQVFCLGLEREYRLREGV
jgi:hypothetical protein